MSVRYSMVCCLCLAMIGLAGCGGSNPAAERKAYKLVFTGPDANASSTVASASVGRFAADSSAGPLGPSITGDEGGGFMYDSASGGWIPPPAEGSPTADQSPAGVNFLGIQTNAGGDNRFFDGPCSLEINNPGSTCNLTQAMVPNGPPPMALKCSATASGYTILISCQGLQASYDSSVSATGAPSYSLKVSVTVETCVFTATATVKTNTAQQSFGAGYETVGYNRITISFSTIGPPECAQIQPAYVMLSVGGNPASQEFPYADGTTANATLSSSDGETVYDANTWNTSGKATFYNSSGNPLN